MKEFRKTEDGLFICEECHNLFKTRTGLTRHLKILHNGQKEYYDKWLKEGNEGICQCGTLTKFTGFKRYYKKACCDRCAKIQGNITQRIKYGNCGGALEKNKEHVKKTNLERYGVENTFQREDIKEKCKQTKKERYGNENFVNPEKNKQTCLKKYGVENQFQREEIKEQNKQTHLKNFGAEHPNQNQDQYNKGLKTRFKFHKFRDTDIWYQSSFELDFLEKYYSIFPDMRRGLTIKYSFKRKNRVYYPDFYIPSLNLIIECKNLYLVNRDKIKNNAKKRAIIISGFKYIMIINKNYEKFNKVLFE